MKLSVSNKGEPKTFFLKEDLKLPVEDKTREQEIIDRLIQQTGKDLSEEQLMRIFTAVFTSSKQVQS